MQLGLQNVEIQHRNNFLHFFKFTYGIFGVLSYNNQWRKLGLNFVPVEFCTYGGPTLWSMGEGRRDERTGRGLGQFGGS
jgi:hypothetical protein